MFVELYPLLQKRVLLITADVLPDSRVRLTISQKPKDKDEKLPGLYLIEGTPEEVDSILVEELKGHTETMVAFHSALEELKASTAATLKEAKAEADKKIAEAKKTGKSGAAAVNAKVTPAVKPEPPKPPQAPSLFDTAPAPAEAAAPVVAPQPLPVAETAEGDGDDIDPDDEPNGSDDDADASEEVSDDASAPAQTLVTASAVTEPSQSSMFASASQLDEEAYQFEEAFDGRESQLIAA